MQIVLFVLLSIGFFCQAQQTQWFKSVPHITDQTPEWAKQMYGPNPDIWQIETQIREYYHSNPLVQTADVRNYKFWRRKVEPFIQETGFIALPSAADLKSWDESFDNQVQRNGHRGSLWNCIGPFETRATEVGQPDVSWQANVYCIDIFPQNANILYCGTEAGGIFKTTNKGLNWVHVSHQEAFQTIHAIKIHPNNPDIVFAGDNQNIYRTINSGQSWSVVYVQTGLGVNDLSINPADPNIILAATDKGLFRSIDGGDNWTQLYTQACWDIELKPDNPDIVYLLKTNPQANRCEFFRSVDKGASFTQQSSGWYFSNEPNRNDGGARMTVTPADPDRIYCVLIGNSKAGDLNYIGVYRSLDAGLTWTNPRGHDGAPYTNSDYNLATFQRTSGFDQGYYNLTIAASHSNPQIVLVGCLSLSISYDGATSFNYVGGYHGSTPWLHPDQQDLKILGNDMFLANDGGVDYSTDHFATLESRKNGITASDFWGFGTGWNEDIVVGGRYHNGNTGRRDSYPFGKYHRLGGAEAPTGYVNPGNNLCYFSDISTKILGQSYFDPAINMGSLSLYPNEFYWEAHSSELEFHPVCYNHLFLGHQNSIYKSENGGISFDTLYTFGTQTNRPILQIEVSRSNPEVIYAHAMQSNTLAKLLVSRDGGKNWTVKDFPPNVQSMRAGSMSLSPEDENKLWVSFGQQFNNMNKVFVTTDGGDTWINLTTATLNNQRAVQILVQSSQNEVVYLATNKGVYYRDNTMTDWQLYQAGLPGTAASNILRPFYKNQTLRLATYGHGLWEAPMAAPVKTLAQPMVDKLVSQCPRDTFYFEDYSMLAHTGAQWNWSFQPQPTYISSAQVRNPKVVFGQTGTYSVTLTVTDQSGQTSSKTIPQMVEVMASACFEDTVPGIALRCYRPTNSYAATSAINMGLVSHFTISAWIKPDGIQSSYAGIVFSDNGGACGLNFKDNNQLGYHWSDGSGSWSWSGGPVADTGRWQYVALVITPDSATIYLDGNGYTRIAPHAAVNMQSIWQFGKDRGWESRVFHGWMDEISLYNRALSQNEIRELRHLTRRPSQDASLVAYYQFNETEGTVYDRAALNHAWLSGQATRETSSAPVGGGKSHRMEIRNAGNYNFQNVSVTLKINQPGGVPDGDLVISRLHVPPFDAPASYLAPENGYFIFNNYGTNQLNFRPDSVIISSLGLGNQYLGQLQAFTLNSREANAEGAWLNQGVHPVQTSENTGFSLIFDEAIFDHLNQAGQLAIATTWLSGTHRPESLPVKVYPTLAARDDVLAIHTALSSYTVELWNSYGKNLLTTTKSGRSFVTLPGLASGLYFVVVRSEAGSFVQKVVVR